LGTLVFAQAASADTFTVNSGDNLQDALTAAALNPGDDDVAIGPGEFHSAAGFSYGPAAIGAVTITGSGTSTQLSFDAGTGFTTDHAGVVVQNLSMTVPDDQTGFVLDAAGTLRDVTIEGPARGLGARVSGGSTVDGVTIDFSDPAQQSFGLGRSIAAPGTTPIQVTGSSVTATAGIDASDGPAWNVDHTRFTGRFGLNLTNADATLVNSVFEKTIPAGTAAALQAEDGNPYSLSLTNVTGIDRTSDAADAGAFASGNNGSAATLTVAASLFGGFDDVVGGSGNVTDNLSLNASFANLADTPVASTSSSTPDYRPLADSALIDRADDSGAGSTDVTGVNPRAEAFVRTGPGPHRDIGAFELQPHAPTLTALNPDPPAGTSVTFHPNDADQDPGDHLTYLWSFDGGSSQVGVRNQTHNFGSTGAHTVSLTVVDLSGRTASASTTVTIPSPPPHSPTVSLTASNGSPAAGEDVQFTATASDADGDPLDFLWSFDGGPASSGLHIEHHSFSSPGPHTASVTVVDPTNRFASASVTVTVPSPPASPAAQTPQDPTPVALPTSNLRAGTCINAFNGTPGADKLTGSAFGDAMVGGGGNDVLIGLGGDDCLIGDEGNDTLDGGDGDDDLRGLAGKDKVRGSAGNDNLLGGSGKDVLYGGSGNDAISGGRGVDRISAGPGKDKVNAADGKRERVNCGSGRDTVTADRIDRLISCERKHLRGRKKR
jgi:Ca2+-binding RTX toxin-like protein